MRNFLHVLTITVLLYQSQIAHALDETFPGRLLFRDVPTIAMNELYNQMDKVVIVDTRSKLEFETLRILGAIHVPLAGRSFRDDIIRIRASSSKPIIFYCNGHTCYKSYEAVRKARYYRVDSVYAFDAGVIDWAKNHPEFAVLLGKNPIRVDQLIDSKKYLTHVLEPSKFSSLATSGSAIVIDVRDRYQRAYTGFYPGYERRIGLEEKEKLTRYIKRAKRERKALLVYDAVGKQVRWLQYFLEQGGLKNYYFMRDGAKGYYDMISQR